MGLDFKGEVLEGNLFVGQQNALLGWTEFLVGVAAQVGLYIWKIEEAKTWCQMETETQCVDGGFWVP